MFVTKMEEYVLTPPGAAAAFVCARPGSYRRLVCTRSHIGETAEMMCSVYWCRRRVAPRAHRGPMQQSSIRTGVDTYGSYLSIVNSTKYKLVLDLGTWHRYDQPALRLFASLVWRSNVAT